MDYFVGVFVLLLGLIIGSFLNVCIYRIPLGISVADGHSKCTVCGHRIRWYDLVPVLSYLVLGGKCRDCKAPISPRYAIVEALTGSLFLLCFLRYGYTLQTLLAVAMMCLLIPVAFIDAEHKIIPDRFIVCMLVLGAASAALAGEDYLSHVIGFFAVSVPFLLVAALTGGMGGGDVKLMAAAGLFLGWQSVLVALIVGSVAGTAVILVPLLKKKVGGKTEIAFGPYLAAGIAFAVLYGSNVIEWYLRLCYGA